MPNVDKLILQHTDLDLNKSANLPMCEVDVGLGPDSLSKATRAALTTGYQTDAPEGGDSVHADNEDTTNYSLAPSGGGFLGRPTGFQR